MQKLDNRLSKRIEDIEETIEALSIHKRKSTAFMKLHKEQYKSMHANLGLINFNYKEYEARIRELGVAEEKIADTEKYLGYIQPIKM